MSNTSHCAFNGPPLPRYRYHHKSGTWRKEKVQTSEDATAAAGPPQNGNSDSGKNTETTVTALAAGASSNAAQATHVPFESSYDFFLRSVKPPVAKRTQAEREACKSDATRVSIRNFEAALFKKQLVGVSGRWLRATSDVPERGGSAPQTRKFMESAYTATVTTTTMSSAGAASRNAEGLHPLIGYTSSTSMPAVFVALAALKQHPLNFTATSTLADRLSRSDFYTFLAAVGPVTVLSPAYKDVMFRSLPSYSNDTDTVDVLSVLTLLLDHRYHPQFDANVTALFRSFDEDRRGVIVIEALHPDVLSAWAAVRTFGNLREQWIRFAVVMAEAISSGAVRLPHMPELVPRNAVRAFLTCTEALYRAACSLDLDGGSL